jgi:lipoate-protein ligase A
MAGGKSVFKVQGGKLLKISLEHSGGRIESVKIAGDFFLHPEEAVGLIENGLEGSALDEIPLKGKIEAIVKKNSLQLFGFAPADLAAAIMMAVNQ